MSPTFVGIQRFNLGFAMMSRKRFSLGFAMMSRKLKQGILQFIW